MRLLCSLIDIENNACVRHPYKVLLGGDQLVV